MAYLFLSHTYKSDVTVVKSVNKSTQGIEADPGRAFNLQVTLFFFH